MDLELAIVYVPSDDNWWTAYLPEIPGAVGQGDSKEAAKVNLIEALNEVFAFRRQEDLIARKEEFGTVHLHIA